MGPLINGLYTWVIGWGLYTNDPYKSWDHPPSIGGIISPWWNHFTLVESFHPGGIISPWWNHFTLVESFHPGGIISPWWNHFTLLITGFLNAHLAGCKSRWVEWYTYLHNMHHGSLLETQHGVFVSPKSWAFAKITIAWIPSK